MVRSPTRRDHDPRPRDGRREHRSRSREDNELLPHLVRKRNHNDDRDGDRLYSSQSRYYRDGDRDRDGDRERDRNYDRRRDHRSALNDRERSPRHHRDRRDDARKTSRTSRSPPRRRHSPHHRASPRDSRKRTRSPSPVRRDSSYRDGHSSKRSRTDRSSSPRRRDDGRPSDKVRGYHNDRSGPKPLNDRHQQGRGETEEEKEERLKKERLKKVEAWKAKLQAKKPAAASPLQVSKDADGTPMSAATDSPAAINSPVTTDRATPQPNSPSLFQSVPDEPGKRFDYKAYARPSAASAKQKKTLDGDVMVPKAPNGITTANGVANPTFKKTLPSAAQANNLAPTQGVSSVRLTNAATNKIDKSMPANAVSELDDEVVSTRKLEKLPDMPAEDDRNDASLPDEDGDDDQDQLEDDEEAAEAAREAAQKRALAQTEQQDVSMADPEPSATSGGAMDVDEDIDPLDAFMSTLDTTVNTSVPVQKDEQNVAQRFDSDDENDLDAIGDGTDDFLALAAAKKKRRDVPVVDHSKIEYEDFRRDFYVEPQEYRNPKDRDLDESRYSDQPTEVRDKLKKEDEEQIEQDRQELARDLREELDGIKIHGKNSPLPIQNWTQAGFGTKILDIIRDMKFEKPTAIQCQALPAIMSGRDVIGIAKTGSGKTLAFVLPMFRHIKDQRPLENMEGPIGLILAPTRELAVQIHRDCRPFCKALGLRAVCAYGGAPIKDQIAELKRGAEIVVCTAGRLIDLMIANSGRVLNLRRVTYVVMDEADRMFDMGFEPQISKIMKSIRPDRQTVLFSATFRSNMEALARTHLKKPLEILVGGRSVVAKEITQQVEVVPEGMKFRRTLQLLGNLHDSDEEARSLIFVEKQETADSINRDLAVKGYPCVSIHGGREQIDRDQAISDFKAGHFPIMVATSVAARGLDVKELKMVINFDSPNHAEDYVHRCGRTGRAGNTGTAVTYVTPEQGQYARFLTRCLTDSGQEVPAELKKLNDEHEEKVKAGEAKKATGGFGGRGIDRLQAARDAERARERKQYKTGDEPDEEEEVEEKDQTKKMSKVDELMAKATGGVRERDAQAATGEAAIPTSLVDHLNNAMKVQKAEKPEKPALDANDPLARVNAAAANINSRLGARGTLRSGQPIDNRGPDAGAFHATLEINDFPQKARWAVTNRTNVAKILESTGTSITSKGQFYAPGTEPKEGEPPKIYILVEGDTEVVVGNAMTELTKLLREGAIAHYDQESRGAASGPPGRYSVV